MDKKVSNKDFYLHALRIAVPMILQALITNAVSMVDNIMIGRVGTAQMSGVSIANQLLFVFNITVFGAISGPGIFGTQFFGKKDYEGQKYTVRFRLYLVVVLIALGALIGYFFGSDLIGLYISTDDSSALAADTLRHGVSYLNIMLISLVPFGIGQAYSSVVRECGETQIPMIASFTAIGVNVLLDYCLIFGKLGLPKLGVEGAAIATVIAKIIEAAVVVAWAHLNPLKNQYIVGLYKSLAIPRDLVKRMTVKSIPLLFNEFLWSMGMSIVAQCYSVRGIEVVAARNIASTLSNLFSVVYIQMGSAIGIIVGIELGAGLLEQAKVSAKKLRIFSVIVTAVVAVIMIPFAYSFPQVYNVEESIKSLASFYIIIQAIVMPIWSYTNACYFVLRCGGKTLITFLFDFVFTWFVMIPLAFFLARYSSMDVRTLLTVVTFSEVIKAIVGYFLVRSGMWVNNIVSSDL